MTSERVSLQLEPVPECWLGPIRFVVKTLYFVHVQGLPISFAQASLLLKGKYPDIRDTIDVFDEKVKSDKTIQLIVSTLASNSVLAGETDFDYLPVEVRARISYQVDAWVDDQPTYEHDLSTCWHCFKTPKP